ncbi:hypothetical protein V9T40_010518 [Parthenolecanium corni]|uniref:Uncharacterized protein n=1 Tax=Parthenolecanium corni TaxID=536013 RepID=A0AAN9XXK6_9HEMI
MRETTSSNPKDDPECARILAAHCVKSAASADARDRPERSPNSDQDDSVDDVACPDCTTPGSPAPLAGHGGGRNGAAVGVRQKAADCPICAVNDSRSPSAPTVAVPQTDDSAAAAASKSSARDAVDAAAASNSSSSSTTTDRTTHPSDGANARPLSNGGSANNGAIADDRDGKKQLSVADGVAAGADAPPHSGSDRQKSLPSSEETSSARGDAKSKRNADENSESKKERKKKKKKKKKKQKNDRSDAEAADDDDGDEEESETRRGERRKPHGRGRSKSVLEYDIGDMYPEMEVLTEKKRHEWDYLDERVIRALWLETKTNVLADWKERAAKRGGGGRRSKRPPAVEVRLNHAAELRFDYRQRRLEQREAERRRDERLRMGGARPHFGPVTMATNTTAVLRHQYNRNDPPVPSRYLRHYDKYRRPPFNVFAVKRCVPIT